MKDGWLDLQDGRWVQGLNRWTLRLFVFLAGVTCGGIAWTAFGYCDYLALLAFTILALSCGYVALFDGLAS